MPFPASTVPIFVTIAQQSKNIPRTQKERAKYQLFFHKGLKRTRFDVEKYNQLRGDIAEVELDLKRLRDPLQLQLPVQQLTASKD
ncbi:unnamed protein product [Boreogadus saida]